MYAAVQKVSTQIQEEFLWSCGPGAKGTIRTREDQKSPHQRASFRFCICLYHLRAISASEEGPARPWEQSGEELIEISDKPNCLHNTAGAMQVAITAPGVLPSTPSKNQGPASGCHNLIQSDYSMILATTPAPTVRPPSRIAKRRPSSIAIGAIRVTVSCTLSPGITISTPSGSSTAPVTSVVRK